MTAAIAFAALAATPAVGQAASTVGSDLALPVTVESGCEVPSTCTRMLVTSNGEDVGSPVDGVIVGWKAVGKGTIRLRVVSRGGDTWTAGAVSEPATFPSDSDQGEFETRLPIRVGEYIAVEGDADNHAFMAFKTEGVDDSSPFHGTVLSRFWFPALGTGSEPEAALLSNYFVPLVSAEVEPDADGDGYGDETQDPDPPDPGTDPEPTLAPTPAQILALTPAPTRAPIPARTRHRPGHRSRHGSWN